MGKFGLVKFDPGTWYETGELRTVRVYLTGWLKFFVPKLLKGLQSAGGKARTLQQPSGMTQLTSFNKQFHFKGELLVR